MTKPEPPRMEIVVDGVDGTLSDVARATQAADYRNGVRAAVGILAVLCLLCVLAAMAKC